MGKPVHVLPAVFCNNSKKDPFDLMKIYNFLDSTKSRLPSMSIVCFHNDQQGPMFVQPETWSIRGNVAIFKSSFIPLNKPPSFIHSSFCTSYPLFKKKTRGYSGVTKQDWHVNKSFLRFKIVEHTCGKVDELTMHNSTAFWISHIKHKTFRKHTCQMLKSYLEALVFVIFDKKMNQNFMFSILFKFNTG